jgi:polyhydroxyalkanoate synthase
MSPEIMQNLVHVLNQHQSQAPRPLALHLAIQTMTFTSSLSGLTNLNAVSRSWKKTSPHVQNRLLKEISNTDPQAFAAAVQAEVQSRVQDFAKGVNKLNNAARVQALEPLPCVFEEGTTRLVHAVGDGSPVILIPSLINRAYILDLGEKNSLTRALAKSGLDVYLVDWDAPGKSEQDFTIDDYIDRLERIRDHVAERAGQKPMVAGYCMGGLLALALVARAQNKIAKLALLATPWDFSEMPQPSIQHLRNSMPWLSALIDAAGVLPVDVLQAMFVGIDPCATSRKFRQFASMPDDGASARAFVQLEDWVNDGVPLAGPVAMECLKDWYIENEPGRGKWQTRDVLVNPSELKLPTWVVVPENDTIVPPETATPLGNLIPNAKLTSVASGHIGMIAGTRAKRQLYDPLSSWLVDSD